MGGYADFAAFYDRLTDDVGYPQRADYIAELLMEHGMKKGIVLDLACGTGSLTLELSKRGYEMIGVDASPDMLCAAQEKCAQAGAEVLFLCQPMEALDLYGTVNAAVCTLDSLNHITDPDTLREVLRRVSLFLEPGGLFVFDVNTPYKHREVLGNHTLCMIWRGFTAFGRMHIAQKILPWRSCSIFLKRRPTAPIPAMGSSSQSVHTAMKSFALLRRRQGSRLPAIMKR